MIDKVRKYIRCRGLLEDGQRVTVALSGGSDSVCLLRVLLELGYEVEAAHCNFHLRGDESDRDEAFCRRLCEELGVTLHVRHFDTRGEMRATGKSLEMAARDLRYDWFASIAGEIAVGHHKDDNAETLLLNLMRGSGLTGLTGMRPARLLESGLRVVRPLLCVGRREILDYLRTPFRGSSFACRYVADSTNGDMEARRNVLRKHIAAIAEETGVDVVEGLNRSAGFLSEAHDIYSEAVARSVAGCVDGRRIDMGRVGETAAPQTVLHEVLSPYGFNSRQTAAIWNERNGVAGRVYESGEWRLLRDRGCWILRGKTERTETLADCLPLEGEVEVTEGTVLRVSRLSVGVWRQSHERGRSVATLDVDKLSLPLGVRVTRTGDRFVPFGMAGSRLVSDYLTDRHRNVFDKESQLVVTSGDEIAWVVGERISALFGIDEGTRMVMRIEVSSRGGEGLV